MDVEAKVEVCLILQLLYDMYTDHRVKALVARCTRRCTRLGPAPNPTPPTPPISHLCRYKALYVTHVENKLWRRAGLQKYEESLPFDKPDIDHELPKFLAAEYPGLQAASVGAEATMRPGATEDGGMIDVTWLRELARSTILNAGSSGLLSCVWSC